MSRLENKARYAAEQAQWWDNMAKEFLPHVAFWEEEGRADKAQECMAEVEECANEARGWLKRQRRYEAALKRHEARLA
jgi:hypothetical protein